MAAEQTKAIVLRTVEFSETSLVVTLLTRDFGQIVALAKGARRPKGPFDCSLDLLGVCRVVVIRKSSDALDLLTEAKLLRRFRGAERSLERLYAGYYLAEMLRLLTDQHDPHPGVYDLTEATLSEIDGHGSIAASLLYFDAQALRLLGHAPSTSQCTECSADVSMTSRMVFSIVGGGIVCHSCRSRQQQLVNMKGQAIAELERLQSATTSLPVSVDAGVYGELRGVVSRYIQAILNTRPKMQAYLPSVVETESTG